MANKPEETTEDKGVKTRKITDKDFKKVEDALKNELDKRKKSDYRRSHEEKWKVVDRQVVLDPMVVTNIGEDEDWLNVFEIGELARASEVMTSDIMRVVFPEMRSWFEAHVEIEPDIDPVSGEEVKIDKKYQNQVDGRLRAMMTQQHRDFGLRERVEMSVKEALHHGAFVAEVKEDYMDMYFSGTSVKEICSPNWIPHSMWNCWPDPSPSLVGSNMFYTGSMFIRSYMPRHKFLEQATGEGWIPKALKKIPKRENEQKENRTMDVEIITYWGDVVIPKHADGLESSGEDLFFPNHKVIMANGKMVYIDAISTPYPPIIFRGYEKMDVRDPYFMSPIIKQSPIQKIASILSNEFVNGAQLQTRPPIVYDGNDPDFVVNGGPRISPGAKTSTKGSANYKTMEVGNPSSTLAGMQYMVGVMKESLGRPGVQVGDRATKAEVLTKQADSEAGPFGFAVKLDDALRTFLYMQHYMNKKKKNFSYSYYNPELDSPDFIRTTGKELPDTVHFEVVGSKGVLGEERRHQAFVQSTAFLSGNPLFSPLLETMEVAKQIYMDAGVKGPERFLKQGDIPPDIKAKMDQMQGVIQQLGQQLQQLKTQENVKIQKMQLDFKAKEDKIKAGHEQAVVELASKHHLAEEDNKKRVDDALTKMERIVREFEHKIEMLIALEKKEQEGKASEGDKAKESQLTETLLAMHDEVMRSVQEVARQMVAPRKVLRDESGRISGTEIMNG